ncbi:CLIP-associating protein 1-B-like isoform X2 [Limulus polyphemus]|uniref:CLIP-associating protein 1-B-like isoform X2 n=1 Tax=Limulus polyphemus TaxID=6850 RepID=A0ABM1S9X1_LIMPO|nr:CLIP-associating protein 1-B-like isoform X2 [Limulus polyphemus]
MASSLDDFLPLLSNQDTKKRIQLGNDIIKYLENQNNSIECEEFGFFVDSIASWLNGSNFKISQNGLEILGLLADRMKDDFRPYISTVLSGTVDRMGDNKDQVRNCAKDFMLKLMIQVSSPQLMFEKLMSAFNHKNWRVKEEMLVCLQGVLDGCGAQSLTVSKLMPSVVKLLGDPNSQVRESANITLLTIYKHIGEKIRQDLIKRHNLPTQKLQAIFAKFDEIKDSGGLLSSAIAGVKGDDDTDSRSQSSKSASKRASSAPPTRRSVFTAPKPPTTSATLQRKQSVKTSSTKSSSSASAVAAGAADEDMFIKAFEDVPKLQLYSGRDLEVEIGKIKDVLSNPNNDWEKRIESIRRLRSLIVSGAMQFDELYTSLRLLEIALQVSVKDLRSQVVREACITIAYFSQQLGIKFDHFAESVFPNLVSLIPNSAKIMSTAGVVAIRFIIQYTHAPKLIPILTTNMSCKSKDIRKTCCEFLDQLLHIWPTNALEKYVNVLRDAIKKGISDADPEARAFSRKAFWGFADHFKEQADSLLSSLDSGKQRLLQGELSMSNSSSSNSLNSTSRSGARTSHSSSIGSTENLSRSMTSSMSSRKSSIPVFSSPKKEKGSFALSTRSNSAIDVAAAKRAKARAGSFSSASHLTRGSGASLPRAGTRRAEVAALGVKSPERTSRNQSKTTSHSQPNSRSGSPSSRLSYATYQDSNTLGRVRRKSGAHTASGSSREASPSRSSRGVHERRLSGGSRRTVFGAGGKQHPTTITTKTPVMAERMLQQSKEAEAAMADVLKTEGGYEPFSRTTPRHRHNNFHDDQSDESETSSICSDRSFSSYSGHVDDVADIIHNLSSIHWSDRKEGLLGLCALFRSSRLLTSLELHRVVEIFSKMFMDPHTKVFTLFLDTLKELIHAHHAELHGWLYVLMTRLLMKCGTDVLSSVQAKIQRTLDIIRDCFPCEKQFYVIVKFLNDPHQTPNDKVKIILLHYLHSVLKIMDPSDFSGSSNETKIAVIKLISWKSEVKVPEIRKYSQDVILDMFNLNTPEFSMLLNQLPKPYQDSAFNLLSSRRRSTDSTSYVGISKTPGSPIMSHLQSPTTTLSRMNRIQSGMSFSQSFEYDDTENLNPEDIYNSLKKTSAEIQKYSRSTLEKDFYGKDSSQKQKDDQTNESMSLDSGISQTSAPDGRLDVLEERSREVSSSDSSPTKCSSSDYNPVYYHDQDMKDGLDVDVLEETVFDVDSEVEDADSPFINVLTELNNHNTRQEQRKQALYNLVELAKDSSLPGWETNFRNVLRLVIEMIGDQESPIRVLALRTMCELLQRQAHNFQGYMELTILKILEANKDEDKEVMKAAEVCCEIAGSRLPAEQCVRTLKPIIRAGEYPVNMAAVKMLKPLVEHNPRNVVLQLLPEMMPSLIRAYDNTESSVRKAAVFCMVAIYNQVGENLTPHLTSLSGSKMKLLNLYIKRSQTTTNNTSDTVHKT